MGGGKAKSVWRKQRVGVMGWMDAFTQSGFHGNVIYDHLIVPGLKVP